MHSQELYRQVILDHNRNPRNYGALPNASHSCEGFNPLCGDKLTVYLQLDDERLKGVKFTGEGCAISKASASLMSETIKNKTVAEVEQLFAQFRSLVRGELTPAQQEAIPEKLKTFATISAYPARVKCAMLAWHAVLSAIEKQPKVDTESSY